MSLERPAYRTTGDPITLVTNHFSVFLQQKGLGKDSEEIRLYVYPLDVKKVDDAPTGPPRQVTGALRQEVLREVLDGMHKKFRERAQDDGELFGTDFNTKLVSAMRPEDIQNAWSLQLEGDHPFKFPGQKKGTFVVEISKAKEVVYRDVSRYLLGSTPTDGPSIPNTDGDDATDPGHEQFISALNVILGYQGRKNSKVLAATGNRFFDDDEKSGNLVKLGDCKWATRGYFYNIRPVASRLLLNANVIHAVLRRTQQVSEIFKLLEINKGGDWAARKRRLEFLIGARVQIRVKRGKGKTDGLEIWKICGIDQHGPHTKRFKLNGQETTVKDHFQKSMKPEVVYMCKSLLT
jgi:hypothetical protein